MQNKKDKMPYKFPFARPLLYGVAAMLLGMPATAQANGILLGTFSGPTAAAQPASETVTTIQDGYVVTTSPTRRTYSYSMPQQSNPAVTTPPDGAIRSVDNNDIATGGRVIESYNRTVTPSYYGAPYNVEPAAGMPYGGDPAIATVQQALSQRGYYRGAANGLMDADTQRALRFYQSNNRLEATGLPNDETFYSLGLIPRLTVPLGDSLTP